MRSEGLSEPVQRAVADAREVVQRKLSAGVTSACLRKSDELQCSVGLTTDVQTDLRPTEVSEYMHAAHAAVEKDIAMTWGDSTYSVHLMCSAGEEPRLIIALRWKEMLEKRGEVAGQRPLPCGS
jgi:hypothetical protein